MECDVSFKFVYSAPAEPITAEQLIWEIEDAKN